MDPAKIPIRASTQEHLDIEDIRDDLVILKDGGCVLILTTTAINFDLLSEKEQEATIYTYAALLNSLTFSIQIIIRSQKKDISNYLKRLDEAEKKAIKKEIREQIQKYKKFIKETVVRNEVLDKKFYLAIPMSPLEIGAGQTFTSVVRRKKGLPFSKDYILQKAKISLYPKRDHLLHQLARLSLKARQLKTPELIQLFFEIYNPETKIQSVSQAGEKQPPLVQTAPTPPAGKTPSLLVASDRSQAKAPQPAQLKVETPITSSVPTELRKPNQEPEDEKTLRDEIDHLVKESI